MEPVRPAPSGDGASSVAQRHASHELTTHNPFEEDEGAGLVSRIYSRVRSSFGPSQAPVPPLPPPAPSASADADPPAAESRPAPSAPVTVPGATRATLLPRRASRSGEGSALSSALSTPLSFPTHYFPASAAPPLVSLTPAVISSSVSSSPSELYRPSSRQGRSSLDDFQAPGFIPGFPIPDDARSVHTASSVPKASAGNVVKLMKRMRGDGLSRDYWQDDDKCHECYKCRGAFGVWRRKHHCRICGLIFCSRCASTVVPGSRFGHDGSVRACDLCVLRMDEGDDDDDRRSVASASSPFPPLMYGRGDPSNEPHPHSQFAASQLFPAMRAIQEHLPVDDFPSRPQTPSEGPHLSESLRRSQFLPDTSSWLVGSRRPSASVGASAPFRRALGEGDAEAAAVSPVLPPGELAIDPALARYVGSASPERPQAPGLPVTSKDAHPTVALTSATGRGRTSRTGYCDVHFPTVGDSSDQSDEEHPSFVPLRSRVSSRVTDSPSQLGTQSDSSGWKTRRPSFNAPQQFTPEEDLNEASLDHLSRMLRQCLERAGVPDPARWEPHLLPLLLKVARHLRPHMKDGPDVPDVRNYVKVKKIPGGRPRDCEYVDGVVITKNLAHKHMPRHVHRPRILLLTFPLDFFPLDYHQTENQLMSLDPLLSSEKNYLRTLVQRIAAQHPHLVLAEHSVSRLALDYLNEAKIAVARNVKARSINVISRCTQGEIIGGMDKLALNPVLGQCRDFRVQTYEHAFIPGRRKTFMRFEGCERARGCTLVLRGGDLELLKRVKEVMNLLVFVVYNLKLESALLRDEYASAIRPLRVGPPFIGPSPLELGTPPITPPPEGVEHGNDLDEKERAALSARIQRSLLPFRHAILTSSASVEFPPPWDIRRMAELDKALSQLRKARDDEIASQVLHDEAQALRDIQDAPSRIPSPNLASPRLVAQNLSRSQSPQASDSPSHLPPTSLSLSSPFSLAEDHRSLRSGAESISSEAPSASPTEHERLALLPESLAAPIPLRTSVAQRPFVLRKPEDVARESALERLQAAFDAQLRVWEEEVLHGSFVDRLQPANHQNLVVLESRIASKPGEPTAYCIHPRHRTIAYYGQGDETLGQFIERTITDAQLPPSSGNIKGERPLQSCSSKTCGGRPHVHHVLVYVHNDARVQIILEHYEHSTVGDRIWTWSYCKVCGTSTPMSPMSEDTWKYSFGKYLELCFYAADVQTLANGCSHNPQRDHIRYFAWHGFVVRFIAERVSIGQVIMPQRKIDTRREDFVALKNAAYNEIVARSTTYWDSVLRRIRSYNPDAAIVGKSEALRLLISDLLSRCAADRKLHAERLNRAYGETPEDDSLSLNGYRREFQTAVLQWDGYLAELEAYMPSDKDLRRVTSNFSGMFSTATSHSQSTDRSIPSFRPPTDEKSDAAVSPRLDAAAAALPPSEMSDAFSTHASEGSTIIAPSDTAAQRDVPTAPALLPPPAVPLDSQDDATASPGPSPRLIVRPHPRAPSQHEHELSASSAVEEELTHSVPLTAGKTRSSPPRVDPRSDQDRETGTSGVDSDLASFASKLPGRARGGVAEMVKRFDSPHQRIFPSTAQPSHDDQHSDADRDASPSAPRPRMRRGRTEELVRGSRERDLLGEDLTSDNDRDLTVKAVARHRALRSTASGSLIGGRARDAQSTVKGRRSPSPSKLSGSASQPRRAISRPPAARGSQTPSSSRLSLGASPSSTATPPSSFAKPAAKGKGVPRIVTSRTPGPARRIAGVPPNKVSTMTRHWESVRRDAEKDRVRRNALMRNRRARPIATTQAKVEVFTDFREAVKDDSSDESEHSSHADDEFDGDGEIEELDVQGSLRHTRKSFDETGEYDDGRDEAADAAADAGRQHFTVPPTHSAAESTRAPPTPSSPLPPVEEYPALDLTPALAGGSNASVPPSPLLPGSPYQGEGAFTARPSYPPAPSSESDLGSSVTRNTSILKSLAGLFYGDRISPLDYPLTSYEHLSVDSDVIVREDEPSSLIAFTLTHPRYTEALALKRKQVKVTVDRHEVFMPDEPHGKDVSGTWGMIDLEEPPPPSELPASFNGADNANPLLSAGQNHFKFDFNVGPATLTCRVFYAQQFDELRRMCGVHETFAESLARCVKWEATGGKSGAGMLMTQDRRFMLKEAGTKETDAFLRFAHEYFKYMYDAQTRPSALARILGFFRISFKNPTTGRSYRLNLLAMEHLFYQQPISQKFDLKGSMRNRLIETKGRDNEVLLDENLVIRAFEDPLYVRERDKKTLQEALLNDSRFLSSLNVMDYSLVVGITDCNELVVGIIDFIRTYTLDKRLENWVKEVSPAILGRSSVEPTVVTPKLYQQRFEVAMDRYFPLVPDHWIPAAPKT